MKDNERHDAKEKPDDLLEVLGWSYSGDYNIVVWDSGDGQWREVNSQVPVSVSYWWHLPKTPRKPRKP